MLPDVGINGLLVASDLSSEENAVMVDVPDESRSKKEEIPDKNLDGPVANDKRASLTDCSNAGGGGGMSSDGCVGADDFSPSPC